MALDPKVVETLSKVSTATITTILLKKGLRNVWMRGTRPLQPNQPRIGRSGVHAAICSGAGGSGDS